jgi:Ca2+-binding EF-hand superfamily protein
MKLYYKFDLDRGGDIDKEEFIDACERLGMNHNNFGLGEIFDLIDEDGSNSIDFEEFKAAAEGKFVIFLSRKKQFFFNKNW